MIVTDASLAVKWFREEQNSDLAEEFYARHSGGIAAPDLFAIEVAAALVRNANVVKAARPAIERALTAFNRMLDDGAIRLIRTGPAQLFAAAKYAVDLGHSLKDCIYLVLAMEQGCDLVTCDARFAKRAKDVWPGVRVLGD